jgi:hypothetical protein
VAHRPERDKPGGHLPFPPMPAAWREPEPAPRPVPPRTQDLPPAPRTPLEYPSAGTANDRPLTGPLPPQPALRPLSPIAYPGLPVSMPPPYYVPYPDVPYPDAPAADGQQVSGRSATVAGLLQMFMFPFAVGRFYTGHVAIAVAQIAVAWGVLIVGLCLGLVLVAPALVAWGGFLWPFIDGILLLSGKQNDADGRPLRP